MLVSHAGPTKRAKRKTLRLPRSWLFGSVVMGRWFVNDDDICLHNWFNGQFRLAQRSRRHKRRNWSGIVRQWLCLGRPILRLELVLVVAIRRHNCLDRRCCCSWIDASLSANDHVFNVAMTSIARRTDMMIVTRRLIVPSRR